MNTVCQFDHYINTLFYRKILLKVQKEQLHVMSWSILFSLTGLCHTGVQLLALLVPTLISYLLDETSFSSASSSSKGLHEFALQNLMHIGPLYPVAFKTVIGAAPELKIRLEAAIRSRQANNKAKAAARQPQPSVQAAPTIKLKTSFF